MASSGPDRGCVTRVFRLFYQHMPPFAGGAALRGASVAAAVARSLAPVKVEVFTSLGDDQPALPYRVRAWPRYEVPNQASASRRLLAELLLGLTAGFALVRDRPAALLLSSPFFLPMLLSSWWARLWGIPYVLELRDIYPQVYAQAGLLREGGFAYRLLLRWSVGLYRHARAIIALTEGLQREVALLSPHAMVHFVPNGFPEDLLSRRPQKAERFTACFHGILGYFQDIETLVAVAGRLAAHDIDVVVVGYGQKQPLLEAQSPPNLQFKGRQPFAATIDTVARCHVGLCLRRADDISRDAFPIKVWEYLGLGMPAIVTPACDAGAFVERHGCGLQLPAGDIDGIVAAVVELRADRARYQAMAAAAEEAGRAFTREALAEQVVGHLRDALPEVGHAAS